MSSKCKHRTAGVHVNPISRHRAASSDSFKEQRAGPHAPGRRVTPARERRLANTRHPFDSSPFSFKITIYKCNRYVINWLNLTSLIKTYLLELILNQCRFRVRLMIGFSREAGFAQTQWPRPLVCVAPPWGSPRHRLSRGYLPNIHTRHAPPRPPRSHAGSGEASGLSVLASYPFKATVGGPV